MNVRVRQGDIFTIPDVTLNDDVYSLNRQIRLAKVIFVSKITKRMIGILISEHIYESLPSEVADTSFVHKVLYTGNQLLKSGEWDIVGNQIVTEIEEDLTVRIVGCGLRRLDVNLGVVSDSDRRNYGKQYIKGFGLIYGHINDM